MANKRNKGDMPVGKLMPVKDFLPPPSELIFPDKTKKITIQLSEASIEFFKKAAHKHHTKYQRLIRQVLDRYAEKYV